MTARPCPRCERPITDAHLCTTCTTELAAVLRDITGHRQPVPAEHAEVVEHRARHGQHCDLPGRRAAHEAEHDCALYGEDCPTFAHDDDCPPLPPRHRWVPGLLDALDGVLARESRVTNIGPTFTTRILEPVDDHTIAQSMKPQPLPFALHASSARARLVAAINAAATAVNIDTQPPAAAARALRDHLEQFRHHTDAGHLAAALFRAVQNARDVVDRPADARYAGPCGEHGSAWQVVAHARTERNRVLPDARQVPVPAECDGQLYAEDGSDYVRCPVCGTQHQVTARRDQLLDEAEDRLASIGVLAAMLNRPDRPVTRKMLDGYVERGRLAAHGSERRGTREVALFRVGEARALVEETAARRRKMAG